MKKQEFEECLRKIVERLSQIAGEDAAVITPMAAHPVILTPEHLAAYRTRQDERLALHWELLALARQLEDLLPV